MPLFCTLPLRSKMEMDPQLGLKLRRRSPGVSVSLPLLLGPGWIDKTVRFQPPGLFASCKCVHSETVHLVCCFSLLVKVILGCILGNKQHGRTPALCSCRVFCFCAFACDCVYVCFVLFFLPPFPLSIDFRNNLTKLRRGSPSGEYAVCVAAALFLL